MAEQVFVRLPLGVRRRSRAPLSRGQTSLRRARSSAGSRRRSGVRPFNGTLLVWHLPVLYDLTLRMDPCTIAEHALFFGTALLFWVHLIPGATGRPSVERRRPAVYGAAALGVSWILAIVLGLATRPLYGAYAALPHRPGGLSALADQQLAAGVMSGPGLGSRTASSCSWSCFAGSIRVCDHGDTPRSPVGFLRMRG